jgi:hypothetical protein
VTSISQANYSSGMNPGSPMEWFQLRTMGCIYSLGQWGAFKGNKIIKNKTQSYLQKTVSKNYLLEDWKNGQLGGDGGCWTS